MSLSEPMHNLSADQRHLVEAITNGEHTRLLVVAPPGKGKSYAVSAAVIALLERVPDARILLLAPSAICVYQVAMLADRLPVETPVVEVTGRVRGSALSIYDLDDDGGLRPGVYAISTTLAKREQISARLAATEWDLVVVDEAHGIPAPLTDFVVRLASDVRVRSLVLLSVMPLKDARLTDCLEAVPWALKNRDTSPRFQTVISYQRTPEEQQLYLRLTEFLSVQTVHSLMRDVIERAWRSSIISLEQVLLRARSQLDVGNSAVRRPGFGTWFSIDPLMRSDHSSSRDRADRPPVWLDSAAAAAGMDSLLHHISELGSDSKLEAMLTAIKNRREHGASLPSLVTEMHETAIYLDQALSSRDQVSVRADGRQTALERAQAFGSADPIVVATDVGLQGFELPADTILNYDLPRSRIRMQQRWGRIDRIGREQPATMLALRDTSEVDAVEDELLRLHGYI
jgi:hypothetical protein